METIQEIINNGLKSKNPPKLILTYVSTKHLIDVGESYIIGYPIKKYRIGEIFILVDENSEPKYSTMKIENISEDEDGVFETKNSKYRIDVLSESDDRKPVAIIKRIGNDIIKAAEDYASKFYPRYNDIGNYGENADWLRMRKNYINEARKL